MSAIDGTAFAASSLSVGQTVAAYSLFLPTLTEVRKASTDDTDMIGDVRLGQIAAGALSLGIAASMASLSGSTIPLIVAIIVSVIIAVVYETALRGERVFG